MKTNQPEGREALERRVVALLANELNPKETAEIRRLLESDAALMAFYRRMSRTMELVRGAAEPQSARLSDARRGALLAHLKTPAAGTSRAARRRDWSWVGPLALAACLMILLGGLMLPSLSKSKARAQRIVAWRDAGGDAGNRFGRKYTVVPGELRDDALSSGLEPAAPGAAGAEWYYKEAQDAQARRPYFEYDRSLPADPSTVTLAKEPAAAEGIAAGRSSVETEDLETKQISGQVDARGAGMHLEDSFYGQIAPGEPRRPNERFAGKEVANGTTDYVGVSVAGTAGARFDQPPSGGGPTAGQEGRNLNLFLAQQDLAATERGRSGVGGGGFGGAGGVVGDQNEIVAGFALAPTLGDVPVAGEPFNWERVSEERLAEFSDFSPPPGVVPSTGLPLPNITRLYATPESRIGGPSAAPETAPQPTDSSEVSGEAIAAPSSRLGRQVQELARAPIDRLEDLTQANGRDQLSRRARSAESTAPPPPSRRALRPSPAAPAAGPAPAVPPTEPNAALADRKSELALVPELGKPVVPVQQEGKAIEEQLGARRELERDVAQVEETGVELSFGLEAARGDGLARSGDEVDKLILVEGEEQRAKRLGVQPSPVNQPRPAAMPLPEVETRVNPFSTFSLNVSDVSFKLAAASLQQGQLPDPASVRSEEFVNAFKYLDSAPRPGERVSLAWERARHPEAHNRELLRLSVQTASWGREQGRPLNLVVLLDSSGSMERADRVLILRQALDVLARQLTPQDRISVVAFARTPRLWVDGLAGGNPEELLNRVGRLNPEGGTNLELALDLGYETARKHFMPGGVNRVILMTDGAANLGNVDGQTLRQRVETERKRKIALDCFGIGWEGFNDQLLEELSRNGDGRYGFLNSPAEAATEFAGQLAGALRVAAADVKAQIEFNPDRVATYRQIGYEKHQLTKEQFRDNTVDAAEIGAAESGTALYAVQVLAKGRGPLGVARVRFKVPETGQYEEREWLLNYSPIVPSVETAPPSMKLAAVAGLFAEWLGQNPYAAGVRLAELQRYLEGAPFPGDERVQQLRDMLAQARRVSNQ